MYAYIFVGVKLKNHQIMETISKSELESLIGKRNFWMPKQTKQTTFPAPL